MYLALNRRGQARKVQIRVRQQLGKLSTYTRVLTRPVAAERVEDLVHRILHGTEHAHHPLRHHGSHLCPIITTATSHQVDGPGIDKFRCRKRKKRKKKKRKCHDEEEDVPCQRPKPFDTTHVKSCLLHHNNNNNNNKECQRVIDKESAVNKTQLNLVNKKNRIKYPVGKRQQQSSGKKKTTNNKKTAKNNNNSQVRIVSSPSPVLLLVDAVSTDEDYTNPTTVASDETSSWWDDSTITATTGYDTYDEVSSSPPPHTD